MNNDAQNRLNKLMKLAHMKFRIRKLKKRTSVQRFSELYTSLDVRRTAGLRFLRECVYVR